VKSKLRVPKKKTRQDRSSFEVYEKSSGAVPIRATHPQVSHLSLSAWLDRNVYFPGDRMLVRLKINNEAHAMTSDMRISLMHVARYKVAKTADDNVGKPNTVCKKQITGVPPYYFGTKWIPLTIPSTLPLFSSLHAAITSCFFIQIDEFEAVNERKLTIPITILAFQTLNTLHPVPPTGIIPPSAQIRPAFQPDEEVTKCNSCETPFGVLKFTSHCRHCGKVFCTNCVNSTIRVPKLGFHEPVKVCRACKRVIEETGGVPHQVPKQIISTWAEQQANGMQWVPKSKKEYKWMQTPSYDHDTVCYLAQPLATST